MTTTDPIRAALDGIRSRKEAVLTHENRSDYYVWDLEASMEDVAPMLAALEAAYPIIRDMVDPDECWFDHHGGCQAHGYLSLQPGETCPQYDAKQWLKNLGGLTDE